MPVSTIDFGELHASVTRPVATGIVAHVKKMAGVPQNTPEVFFGDSGTALLEGSTIEGSQNPVRFEGNNRVFIEYSEETIPEHSLTRYTHQSENKPYFYDDNLKLSLRPLYVRSRLVVSLRLRAVDKPTAVRWKSVMSRKISEGRLDNLHEISYYYLIPYEHLDLLLTAHRLRELKSGYGDTLNDYLLAGFAPNVSKIATRDGEHSRLAVKEKQIRVLGRFDFETPPQEEKEESGVTWNTQIDYIVEYDRPISSVARYPISIHSSILPEKWLPVAPEYTLDYEGVYAGQGLAAMQRVQRQMYATEYNPTIEGVAFPKYDDWFIKSPWEWTTWIGRFLVVPDDTNPGAVLDIDSLGPYSLAEPVRKFLKKYRKFAFKPEESPIFIRIYCDNDPMSDTTLTMDSEGVVHYYKELDPRKVYHVCIGFVTNFSMMTPGGQDRVEKDQDLIDVITPDGDWEKAVELKDRLPMRTVTFFGLIAHRASDLEKQT